MKQLVFALLLLTMHPLGLFAQINLDPAQIAGQEKGNEADRVYINPEIPAMFVGGEEKMKQFLRNEFKTPALAKAANVSGSVVLAFVVKANGTVTDQNIMKELGYGIDEEALRVVSLLPKFEPGKIKGDVVNSKNYVVFWFRDGEVFFENPSARGTNRPANENEQKTKVKLEMQGWELGAPLRDYYDTTEKGKLVFDIQVDAQGDLVSITVVEGSVSKGALDWYKNRLVLVGFIRTSSSAPKDKGAKGRITISLGAEKAK